MATCCTNLEKKMMWKESVWVTWTSIWGDCEKLRKTEIIGNKKMKKFKVLKNKKIDVFGCFVI